MTSGTSLTLATGHPPPWHPVASRSVAHWIERGVVPPPSDTFVKQLTPTWLSFVAQLEGVVPPEVSGAKVAHLGERAGLHSLIVAACHPSVEVWVLSDDPSVRRQVTHAAREAGLANVIIDSPAGVPDGVRYTMVTARGLDLAAPAPTEFGHWLRGRLDPGALVAACYRPLGSWGEFVPLQRMLCRLVERASGTQLRRLRDTLEVLDGFRRFGAAYFAQRPAVSAALDWLITTAANDSVERSFEPFMTAGFQPPSGREVAAALAHSGCERVGSAHVASQSLLSGDPALSGLFSDDVAPEVEDLLTEIVTAPPLRIDVFAHGVLWRPPAPDAVSPARMLDGRDHLGWGHPFEDELRQRAAALATATNQTELRILADAGVVHPPTVEDDVERAHRHAEPLRSHLLATSAWQIDVAIGSAAPSAPGSTQQEHL